MREFPIGIEAWLDAYRIHAQTPRALMQRWMKAHCEPDVAWITRLGLEQLEEQFKFLEQHHPTELPLYGVPFAVKDNIDLACVNTTAACPAFAYKPTEHAQVVQRLLKAGAICVGKTNLDQFATGLVGARSPFGAVPNVFKPEFVSGGSSSGSAVLVAKGVVAFSLGTDTAGSGRVPAGLNNVVGLKPSPGSIPMKGVVPACQSLDVVSVFALTTVDASRVMKVIEGAANEPKYQPYALGGSWFGQTNQPIRIGVPLEPECNAALGFDLAFEQATDRALDMGFELVRVDMSIFYETAQLLYHGPWVAERFASVEDFLASHASEFDPVVKEVIESARHYRAVDAFNARYKLEDIRTKVNELWHTFDVLMVPTVATAPSFLALEKDPIGENSKLGQYTNFVNLLGQCAVAVPSSISPSGLPFGVTLIAPGGKDAALLKLANDWEEGLRVPLGHHLYERTRSSGKDKLEAHLPQSAPSAKLAVVGAHLTGMPLNAQLIERGSRLIGVTHTAPHYKMVDLVGTSPKKPGLLRLSEGGGVSIEVEVYEVLLSTLGSFLSLIPHPLGLGKIELIGGEWVIGFICEPIAEVGARDISQYGGWKNYLAAT
jgi:allophanate hydrolase